MCPRRQSSRGVTAEVQNPRLTEVSRGASKTPSWYGPKRFHEKGLPARNLVRKLFGLRNGRVPGFFQDFEVEKEKFRAVIEEHDVEAFAIECAHFSDGTRAITDALDDPSSDCVLGFEALRPKVV